MDGKILLLPGDGIGFEVTEQALKILMETKQWKRFSSQQIFTAT